MTSIFPPQTSVPDNLIEALEIVNQNLYSLEATLKKLGEEFADELHICDSPSQYPIMQKIHRQLHETKLRQIDIQIEIYQILKYQAENNKNGIIEQCGVDTLVAFSNTLTQDMLDNKQIQIEKYNACIRYYGEKIEELTALGKLSAD